MRVAYRSKLERYADRHGSLVDRKAGRVRDAALREPIDEEDAHVARGVRCHGVLQSVPLVDVLEPERLRERERGLEQQLRRRRGSESVPLRREVREGEPGGVDRSS